VPARLAAALVGMAALNAFPQGGPSADPCAPERLPYGSTLLLPIEAAQGVTLGPSPAPYAASIRLHPSLVLDRARQLRVSATLGGALVNPDLEALVGGRISIMALELPLGPLRGVGLHVAAEGVYGTSDRTLLGGAVVADAGQLAQLLVRLHRDVTNDVTLLELGLGATFALSRPPSDVPPAPEPARTYLARVRQNMRIALGAALGAADDVAACRALADRARGVVDKASPRDSSVAALLDALRDAGLEEAVAALEAAPDPLLPPQEGRTEAEAVAALLDGMREVLGS
jgi:hypothetical protein